MAKIKVTKSGLYANPVVSVPHLDVKKGEIETVSDAMAARMCEDGVAELYEGEAADSNEAAVETLADDNSKNGLIAACEDKELDVSGTKKDLAARLVDAGVTELLDKGGE